MDLTTIICSVLKSMLFMVMVFGAYLAFKQMEKGKIRTLFVGYLLFWSLLLFLDIFSTLSGVVSGGTIPLPPPLLSLTTVITSHLVILWFFYNLLFTLRQSFKIIAIHLVFVAIVLTLIMGVNGLEVAQFFYVADTLELAYKDISTQSIYLKSLIVLMQILFSGTALFVSHRLVPIYQKYIEQHESNAAYNLLWIKEVGRILFLVTSAYVFLMVFITYTNACIYYAVVTVLYMRMINILIQHVTLENFDGLYNKLGVKWSWRKMWYVDEVVSAEISAVRSQFNMIIKWIKSDRPYINPQFSFRDITMQFDGVTFNDFDAMLRFDRGLSFQAYIRECRINYAIELMSRDDNHLLLKEIAYKVGFDSNSAFSRAFKAVEGVAASEWTAKK